MVEFMSGYTSSMDQQTPIMASEDITFDIEKPIIPLGELGTTSFDAAGQGNILTNLENSIRMGAKKIQLVVSGGRSQISQGVSSYGKDVRKALREKAEATGVEITGLELSPSLISGLSGQDRGQFSPDAQQRQLNLVRDAIRFAAEVSKGGGVDIWSQEFQRNIFDAEWNKDKETGKKIFYDFSQDEINGDDAKRRRDIQKYLIDDRDGRPIQQSVVRVGDSITRPKYQTAADYEAQFGIKIIGRKDQNGKTVNEGDFVDFQGQVVDRFNLKEFDRLVPLIDPKKKDFIVETVQWDDIVKETEEFNKRMGFTGENKKKTEEYLYQQKQFNRMQEVEGRSLYYGRNLFQARQALHDLGQLQSTAKDIEKKMNPEQTREWIRSTLLPRMGEAMSLREQEYLLSLPPSEVVQDMIQRQQNNIRAEQEQATSLKVAAHELREELDHIKTPEKFAKDRTFNNYAEMGLEAYRVTKEQKLEKPVYVGPEIGWAGQSFGGHPQEFKQLIEESRKKMAKRLQDEEGLDPSAATEYAKKHIKGMLDSSHMSMWYKHFGRKSGETDDEHLKRFNKWMINEAKELVKADVVGGIQLVDSITGEHAHLPVGQGKFDMVKMVEEMRAAGFKGEMVSEGHSEDSDGFGNQRILTETWRAFGAPIGNYAPGQRAGLRSWGGLQHSYFGHTMPTNYIVGAYVPSNEWSLWSETPFE